MDANCKRYLKEFLPAMAVYAILTIVSVWLLKRHGHTPLRFVYALLPVFPAALATWAGIRYFRGMDELQRRIQFEGLAFSFMGTCLIALTWGLLQNVGLPQADVIWGAPLLVFLWGIGSSIASRRYR